MDAQLVADSAELIARGLLATLYIPEQPDAFWAELHAEVAEAATMWLNTCAVMADWTQPIGTEPC